MLSDHSKTAKPSSRAKSRYFLTWRWHFYAGLFVIPFMLMLSVTGLVMLFDDEIEFARYQSILQVTPQHHEVLPSVQLANVQARYPEGTVTQFVPAKQVDLANRFNVKFADGTSRFVTVDPYTGTVLGTIDRSDSWYQLANDIHGELLIGEYGDYLIEVAASLSILLLVTGIYLWWPRDNASRAGFLRLRLNSGKRVMMRDLHANLGGLTSIILLFFLLSGLAWAGIWGGKFVQPWSSFPAQKWDDVPLSTLTHQDLNHGSEEEMPWNLEQTPLPASHDHSNMADSEHHTMTENIGIDAMVSKARELGFTHYKLNFPRSETGVFTLSANTMSGDIIDPTQDRTSHFDQYSGALLADVTWEDYNLVAKAMAAGIALHQGDISVFNKVANALLCLGFVVIAVTGGIMWWLRRPVGQGKLGVPAKFASDGVWKTALVTLVVIGVLFPLAGASIAVALLLDWLLFNRVERLKTVFS